MQLPAVGGWQSSRTSHVVFVTQKQKPVQGSGKQ